MSRILCIDYGDRRLGIALSDPLKIIAKPFHIIDRKITPDFISEIIRLVIEKEVEKIVVGIPITLRGFESDQTKVVKEFISTLKERINLPIISLDERLSSVAAEKSLIKQNIKTGHQKGRIDETAAAIILQEYLDNKF